MSWLFGLGVLMSGFFKSWNFDVVVLCPLKRCLGITMLWLICLRFSMSRCRGVLVPKSWCRGFWSWNPDVVVYVSPRPRFRYHCKNKKIRYNYFNYVAEKYFNSPNLFNIYLHNVHKRIRIINWILYSLVTLYN